MREAIAYIRVSTKRQGESGLGLEAQQATVQAYAKAAGLELVEEFREVETGTRKRDRPQLQAALKAARERGAVLVVAKLDRLSRNVAFLAALMEARVDFTACDFPDMDSLTVHIHAAIAEHEARLISVRTKAALKAARERGVKLGNAANLTETGRAKGRESLRRKAVEESTQATAYAELLKEQGKSLRAIAASLNEKGFATRTGKPFGPVQVSRILKRAEAA